MSLKKLMKVIGYTFKNEEFLIQALTHRSHSSQNNERLEFLGDAILNFLVADRLYGKFEKAREGLLTRIRAKLVNQESLVKLAKTWPLESVMSLGESEKRSGGVQRASIQADMVEAILAAIYLDGGLAPCEEAIDRWLADRWDGAHLSGKDKDPKTRLQEYLQSKQLALPEYEVVKTSGPDHQQFFKVSCQVACLDEPVVGQGPSRRIAEQEAAMMALEQLKNG